MADYFIRPDAVPGDHRVINIRIYRLNDLGQLYGSVTEAQQKFLDMQDFKGEAGQMVLLPDAQGNVDMVVYGAGTAGDDYANSEVRAGSLARRLRAGSTYRFADLPEDWSRELTSIHWGLGAYKFDRYLQSPYLPPKLVLDSENPGEIEDIVQALHLGRDLINTPAGDMGPTALHDEAQTVATRHGASLTAVIGDDLLDKNYPMIHAVGRAAYDPPRLVELNWGDDAHPRLALVGKGITFDTGGLDVKSAAGMRIMKKDMGGAAHALALADMIMAAGLPVRLHLLLAIAENSVSGNAYRPGDVLDSRKGLTVEIDNTDAEGRLVLGDALTKASEDNPALIIDFATLTGAARVALGPTLPPFFSNREGPVDALLQSGTDQIDPFWRLPLWAPYMSLLSSPLADMKNAGGGFAGCITAALFLQKFIGDDQPWMHFDVYGWNPSPAPSHPKGGEMFALRAIYAWLKDGGLEGDFSQ